MWHKLDEILVILTVTVDYSVKSVVYVVEDRIVRLLFFLSQIIVWAQILYNLKNIHWKTDEGSL